MSRLPAVFASMNTNQTDHTAAQTQSALFNFLALAILSVLLLLFAKHARDIVTALDNRQIVEISDYDDVLNEELDTIDMMDIYDYPDVSGPAWEPDDESTTANGTVKQTSAQLATGDNHTQ